MKENEVVEPSFTVSNDKALITVPVGVSINLRELLDGYEMRVLAYVEAIDLGAGGKLTSLSKYAHSACSFRHAENAPWTVGEFQFNATLPLEGQSATDPVPVTVSSQVNFSEGTLIVSNALVGDKVPVSVTFLWGVNPVKA